MSKLEKIDRELEKAREKAAEWQAKVRDLEKQRQEEENSMIVQAVRALKLTPSELAAFFSGIVIISASWARVSATYKTRISSLSVSVRMAWASAA